MPITNCIPVLSSLHSLTSLILTLTFKALIQQAENRIDEVTIEALSKPFTMNFGMYVCMYECMYVCMYVLMYVRLRH